MLSRTNKQTSKHIYKGNTKQGVKERKKERKKHDMGGERLHGWQKALIDDHGDELTFCQGSKLGNFFLQLSSQGQEKAGFTAVIDWRAFLVSLADAHFDYCISASTLDDIVLARTGNESLDIIHIVCMCVWWIQFFSIVVLVQSLSMDPKFRT